MEIELIHKYLEGKLDGNELTAFEDRLSSDVDFRMEVDLQREMLQHLELSNDTAFAQNAILAVHQEYKHTKSEVHNEAIVDPHTPSRRWFVVGLIFIIVLMLLLLIRMLNNDEVKNAKSLQFAEVPELPDASFGTKGLQDENLLNEGAIAFNAKQYDTAILKFNQALAAGSENLGEIDFYKGLSLLGSKKYTQAIESFKSLKTSHPLFSVDADWYLAMAYWYSGDQSSAVPILQRFDSGNYQKKAQAYLKHVGQE